MSASDLMMMVLIRLIILNIEILKLQNDHVSTINYVSLRTNNISKQNIDSLAGLLKAKQNISTLKCLIWINDPICATRAYLLEKLASGLAGDNLECLELENRTPFDNSEAVFLERYLNSNRNLKTLKFSALDEDPAALKLISTVSESTVTHLDLCVVCLGSEMRELGARLRQCSSIYSL